VGVCQADLACTNAQVMMVVFLSLSLSLSLSQLSVSLSSQSLSLSHSSLSLPLSVCGGCETSGRCGRCVIFTCCHTAAITRIIVQRYASPMSGWLITMEVYEHLEITQMYTCAPKSPPTHTHPHPHTHAHSHTHTHTHTHAHTHNSHAQEGRGTNVMDIEHLEYCLSCCLHKAHTVSYNIVILIPYAF
jgi:hypothetical protein